MKYKYTSIALAIFAATTACAAPLEFPNLGFAIAPLDTSTSNPPAQALMMFLPAKDGFAPNVNVMIQPYPGPMADYIALTKKQFEQIKVKVLTEKSLSDKEWTCEYSGDFQGGPQLHWYARAILSSGKVYLVTATTKDSSWNEDSKILKACVDSLSIK